MGKFGELSGKIIVAILLPYQDVVAFWSCWYHTYGLLVVLITDIIETVDW